MPQKKYILTVLICLIFGTKLVQAEPLLVYFQTAVSVKERESKAKAEFDKNQVELVLFAKFREFLEEVRKRNPNMLIAPSEYSLAANDYVPMYQLRRSGKSKFKIQMYSLSKDKVDFAKAKLGLVETTDREKLKELAKKWFGVDVPIIKSVTKPEDLFPLMVFKSVDIIAVQPEDLPLLKEKFTTEVFQVAESSFVQYPVLFMKKDVDVSQFKTFVKQISPAALNSLGFSDLEEITSKEGKQ